MVACVRDGLEDGNSLHSRYVVALEAHARLRDEDMLRGLIRKSGTCGS